MLSNTLALFAVFLLAGWLPQPAQAQIQDFDLLNAPVDVSPAFRDFENTYYLADSLARFDPETASGTVRYERYEWVTRQAFNNMLGGLSAVPANEFPGTEYAASPTLPFRLQFVVPKRADAGMDGCVCRAHAPLVHAARKRVSGGALGRQRAARENVRGCSTAIRGTRTLPAHPTRPLRNPMADAVLLPLTTGTRILSN